MSPAGHTCVFCDQSYNGLKELVAHLVAVHRDAKVLLPGRKAARFRVYNQGGRRVLCFCGKRFTSFLTPEPAPAFLDWAERTKAELDEYCAHLKREGGTLTAHLRRVKDAALLEHVEKGGTRPEPVVEDLDDAF